MRSIFSRMVKPISWLWSMAVVFSLKPFFTAILNPSSSKAVMSPAVSCRARGNAALDTEISKHGSSVRKRSWHPNRSPKKLARLNGQWVRHVPALQDRSGAALCDFGNLRAFLWSCELLNPWRLRLRRRFIQPDGFLQSRERELMNCLSRLLLRPVTSTGERNGKLATDLREAHIRDTVLLR